MDNDLILGLAFVSFNTSFLQYVFSPLTPFFLKKKKDSPGLFPPAKAWGLRGGYVAVTSHHAMSLSKIPARRCDNWVAIVIRALLIGAASSFGTGGSV